MSAETTVSPAALAVTASAVPGKTQRLMSVDALRGFDMFWIIGADSLVYALDRMANGPDEKSRGFIGFLAYELDHADWAGFHFYDLIFPLFLFIVGVSLVFSLGKTIRQEGRAGAVKRIIRRSVLMFLVALFYSGGFANSWPDIRLMGVLNRIAICYGCAGIIFCFCNLRMMIGICASLLVGYWALLTFVPIRDIQLEKTALVQLAKTRGVPFDPQRLFYGTTHYVTGHFEHGFNLSDHIDFQYLPGRKYDTYFDPEGFLSTLPAIGTCLLGVFAGLLLANSALQDAQKFIYLIMGGLMLVALGWAWSAQFPVVKKIWTSSFVFVAGGYSALLLGVFYWIVDIAKYRAWCQPFVWMGMNSITIYLIKNFLGGGFGGLSKRFVGGDVRAFLESHLRGGGDLAMAVMGLVIAFWLVHFLYRRQIFLRL
jgi:predicted acyltransferase